MKNLTYSIMTVLKVEEREGNHQHIEDDKEIKEIGNGSRR